MDDKDISFVRRSSIYCFGQIVGQLRVDLKVNNQRVLLAVTIDDLDVQFGP